MTLPVVTLVAQNVRETFYNREQCYCYTFYCLIYHITCVYVGLSITHVKLCKQPVLYIGNLMDCGTFLQGQLPRILPIPVHSCHFSHQEVEPASTKCGPCFSLTPTTLNLSYATQLTLSTTIPLLNGKFLQDSCHLYWFSFGV